MGIPGFARARPVPEAPGDRFVAQHITCAEEVGPLCDDACEGSWNRNCYRDCVDDYCSGPYEPG
ncbi:hypothetical protein [Streptomyces sp. NPDC054849]